MSLKKKTIVADGGFPAAKREPPKEPDKVLDFDEVVRRNDDIDQLTADYIEALMEDEFEFDPDGLGLDPKTLEAIEDAFESILADHGIFIYRPTVIEDEETGLEVIVPSAYSRF